MTHEDARRAARAEIGSLEAVKEGVRDVGWESRIETIWRDVLYAVRTLRASPSFTLIAILTLALGIGANTAIFGVVNSLLLRPLPVKDPERLVMLVNARGRSGANSDVWEHIRQQSDLFDGVLAWSSTQFNLGSGGQTQWVDGITASGSFFSTLGVHAVAGRTFSDGDDRPGDADGLVVVISHALWQRRFGGTADAIGRTLPINRVPFTIVGVTPPDFFGPAVGRTFDVIIPLSDYALVMSEHGIANNWLSVMARRKPGQSLEQAAVALRVAEDRMRQAALSQGTPEDLPSFTLRPAATGYSQVRGQYARPLFTVMAVVGLVLLIACANLATLLLARGAARGHELSARLALGASRSRLVQQLLTESLVLAATGAIAGLVIAWWGSRLLVRQLSNEAALTTGRIMFGSANLFLDLSLDWRMLAFTAAVTIGAVLVFGLVPALRVSSINPIDVLKEKGGGPSRSGRSSASRVGLTGSLVVSQVALSLVLVVAAGLLVRTFSSLATVRLGFQPDEMLVIDIASPARAVEPLESLQLYEQALERVRRLPGVAEATVSNVPPFNGFGVGVEVSGASEWVAGAFVSPGWFKTFGTPLVAGRDFTERDRSGTPRVAVVNRAFARAFLNGASPLGRTMTISTETPGPPVEIVGVAEDIASSSLREEPPPVVYVPLAQVDRNFGADILQISLEEQGLSLSVRAERGSPMLLRDAVAHAVGAISPEWMLTFRSLSGEVDALLTQERVIAMLSGFFGVLALLLAAVGLYGVTAYSVSLRRAEMGIRLALGADRVGVLTAILRQSLALTCLGIVIGLGAAAASTRYLEALLWGLTPLDPLTFAGVPLLFAVVAALAAFIPARRATRVDPLAALRRD